MSGCGQAVSLSKLSGRPAGNYCGLEGDTYKVDRRARVKVTKTIIIQNPECKSTLTFVRETYSYERFIHGTVEFSFQKLNGQE